VRSYSIYLDPETSELLAYAELREVFHLETK